MAALEKYLDDRLLIFDGDTVKSKTKIMQTKSSPGRASKDTFDSKNHPSGSSIIHSNRLILLTKAADFLDLLLKD